MLLMAEIINIIKSIVPLIEKISLQDFGILMGIDIAIIRLFVPFDNLFLEIGIFISFLIWLIGFFRNRITIEFSFNNGCTEGNLIFEELKSLKIPSNQSQFEINVITKCNFWGKEWIINKIKNRIQFFLVCDFHYTQINLVLSSPDFETVIVDNNTRKINITDHMTKDEILCPALIMTKNFENKKRLKLKMELTPIEKTRINRGMVWLLNCTIFSANTKFQINN